MSSQKKKEKNIHLSLSLEQGKRILEILTDVSIDLEGEDEELLAEVRLNLHDAVQMQGGEDGNDGS